MLTYYTGTDLSTLARQLKIELDQHPPANPLKPEIFVVQNHGMASWLSLYLAEQRGVAANLKFEFPAERIWKLIRTDKPDIPKTLPSDRAPMTWAIMNVLKNDDDSRLDVLHRYTEEEDPIRKEMRRWKLSGRIADVFDQYLTYRPDMLANWEDPKYEPNDTNERWQSVLWNKLTSNWSKSSANNYPHRAKLQQQVLEAIDNETLDVAELPERVTVFGVSAMPPMYLEILVRLSKLVDVNVYRLGTAAPEAHPLIESFGKTGSEYRQLLEKYISENDIPFKREMLSREPPSQESAWLRMLQMDLIGGEAATNKASADTSIQIHSCHSARREVEVLYDQLLAMFDEDETLNPSDVMVLAPDLDTYAPEIEAVFGTVEEDLPAIPFHLADRSGKVNPIENTLAKILKLAESRFTVTEVLDLLDADPIQKKFELSDENLNTLEQWIDDTHIRWGIDKFFKANLKQPESDSFTWNSGLNRMMLAYAMKADDDRLFEGIYPYGEVEQSEDALLAGRFSNLMESLFRFHREAKKNRTPAEWAQFLKSRLAGFFPEEAYSRELQTTWEVISDLGTQQQLSGFSDPVPFRVIRASLMEALEKTKKGGGGGGKGVTFGSIVQMRNIPSRVIYQLGLNDGSFPRSEIPVAFDLMGRDPRDGDRSHSNEDRQLFLETLLAAKERIYFSYIGQSNRQDATFPPSVILRELMDFLEEHFDISEEEIKTEHPLQSFSPKYFREHNEPKGLFSYSGKNKIIAENLLSEASEGSGFLDASLPEPGEEYRRLTLSELIRFFEHPARYLIQNRLGIYLNQNKILEEDREPFRLEGLTGYHLGQELLQRYLNSESLENYKQVAKATDMLPEGWPGEQAFSQKKVEVQQFGHNLQDILNQDKFDAQEIDLTIDEYRITGKLDQVYSEEQVFYRFGGMRPKDLIELWIKHLAFQQVKPDTHSGRSRLYTKGNNGAVEFFQLPALTDTVSTLENLLRIYGEGLCENTFFFPEISFSFAHEVCFRDKEVEQGLKAAAPRWKSEYSPYPKEGDDAYNKIITGGSNPLHSMRFQEISQSFWKPFFSVLNKEV